MVGDEFGKKMRALSAFVGGVDRIPAGYHGGRQGEKKEARVLLGFWPEQPVETGETELLMVTVHVSLGDYLEDGPEQ